jgi:hypothetical protein
MTASVRETELHRLAPWTTPVDDTTLNELCTDLFACLPRGDQRAKGALYVRGLLRAHGRKSIRKLASVSGGQVSEQSLHHFVSSSTWDWSPIRAALARHVARAVPVHAFVVRPMVTPKAGAHSVGVDRGFSAEAGQVLSAQHAVGVWAASDELSCPVNWRLRLSENWISDDERRNRAAIPDDHDVETTGDCAVSAYLDTMDFFGLPVRPVVFDARRADPAAVVRGLTRSGRPVLIRVRAALPLFPVQGSRPGSGPVEARQVMAAARNLRRPVHVPDPRPNRAIALLAAVPVRLHGVAHHDLALVGEWEAAGRAPSAYWLTDLPTTTPGALATLNSLTRLVDRVDHDFARVTDTVGIREYSGRSYDGWHRHVTLASAAHAAAVLSEVPLARGYSG